MYTLVCCHSFMRCEEIADFCRELACHCPEMLEVINLDSNELSNAQIKLKAAKHKSRLVVSTPAIIQGLLNQGFFDEKRRVMNLVLDKVDLSLAMDYKDELTDIATLTKGLDIAKVVMTTTVVDESEQADEDREAFKELKQRLSGDKKTFLIKVKEDERQVSQFERVHHLYALVSSVLDKYLVLFNMLKLAIVEGKCAVFTSDMVQAYRIKYFLAKFTVRAFVLSPDMAKN